MADLGLLPSPDVCTKVYKYTTSVLQHAYTYVTIVNT